MQISSCPWQEEKKVKNHGGEEFSAPAAHLESGLTRYHVGALEHDQTPAANGSRDSLSMAC